MASDANGSERVGEVDFDSLHAGDVIMLRTENSQYRFQMKDPGQRIGTLLGGRIVAGREAVFAGAVGDGTDFWGDGARTGMRALFFLLAPVEQQGFNRILTSDVKSIEIWRESDRRAA